MTTSLDEAMQDAHEQKHGYDQEVICDCGEAWMVRFRDGEPANERFMTCDACGKQGAVQ